MKIEYKGEVSEIYGIYWISHKTYLYGLPPWHKGAIVYDRDEVNMLDPSLSGRFVLSGEHILTGIYHWALIEKNLIDGVSEREPQATVQFLEILRDEGHKREDYQMIENFRTYGKL